MLATNIIANSYFPQFEHTLPALGIGLWVAILATSFLRRPDWVVLKDAVKGAVFLIAVLMGAVVNLKLKIHFQVN